MAAGVLVLAVSLFVARAESAEALTAELVVAMTVLPASPTAGNTVTYRVVAENVGPDAGDSGGLFWQITKADGSEPPRAVTATASDGACTPAELLGPPPVPTGFECFFPFPAGATVTVDFSFTAPAGVYVAKADLGHYNPAIDPNRSDSIVTLTTTVGPAGGNQAPVATDTAIQMPEDSTAGFILNASDPDGDSLTFQITTQPVNGVLTGEAPNLSYKPRANFFGTDSLTFSVADPAGATDEGRVDFAVASVNDIPLAIGPEGTVTTEEGVPVAIELGGSDLEDSPLTYQIVETPSHGSLSGVAPNLTYTPESGYTGTDTFSFRVNDGLDDSSPAVVTINVEPSTLAPPVVEIDTSFGPAPLEVAVSVADDAGAAVGFDFDWGDGTVTTRQQPRARHTYSGIGEFVLVVTAIDALGRRRASDPIEVQTADGAVVLGNAPGAVPLPASLFPLVRAGNFNLPMRNWVVVLGDSYSSGEGGAFPDGTYVNEGRTHGDCHVSAQNYGAWGGWPYSMLACSGALTRHVTHARFSEGNRDEPPQIKQLQGLIAGQKVKVLPRVVVFTIGGNDLGFARTLRACVQENLPWNPGDDTECRAGLDAAQARIDDDDGVDGHYANVNRVINEVTREDVASPRTNVIVMGYPALFSDRPRGNTCPMNGPEARRTRRLTRAANAVAERAARDAGAIYLSTTPSFQGHHLCDGNNTNDWFVPLREGAPPTNSPEAGHPRARGWREEGAILRNCIVNLDRCRERSNSRLVRAVDRSRVAGGGVESMLLEDVGLPALPVPGVPSAPTIVATPNKYRISWSPVANADLYTVDYVSNRGLATADETNGTSLTLPTEGAPVGTCIHITAFSGDEAEVTGGCTTLPPVPRPPTARDATIGMCKNQLLTRSVAQFASDPDGNIASFRLVETSFAQRTHQFLWSGSGPFTIRIPATTPTGRILTIRWRAEDTTGLLSPVATLSIRAASC